MQLGTDGKHFGNAVVWAAALWWDFELCRSSICFRRDWVEEVCKMYAIIETGGKQYKVQEGDVLFIEKIDAEEGSVINFDKVLAVSKEGTFSVGNPLVEGASVSAKVLGHGKAKKIIVFKYKPKKGYRRKQGHRQPYTKVNIEKINA